MFSEWPFIMGWRSFTGQEPGGWEAGIEPIGAGQTREFGSRFEPGQPTGGSADG